MDEIFNLTYTEAQFTTPLEIPDGDFVYRQVHIDQLDKENGRFPRSSHFKLKPDEKDLSVHWNKYITINEVYYLIGISQTPRQVFRNVRNFHVFSFPVGLIRAIENIQKVVHSPWFTGNPAPIGHPNNYAHASVYYPDDEEVRIKLSNYCNEYHEDSFCNVNFDLLEPIVEELRNRLNETKFYRCKSEDLTTDSASAQS